jgi:hypothetical protein
MISRKGAMAQRQIWMLFFAALRLCEIYLNKKLSFHQMTLRGIMVI